ncbi:4-hydroxy 2-oxovalerate aldolase [Paenibacillus polysaccharolyticus]|uniref:4-hydroxy 2-oxovalerate aldolase n=1 Tax=Paenibacillus polysaccharolyticus TaxID=582692 RepID=A0A1G5K9U2_9BACL|nr:aldolase catalytic domain-containing protein [Paenibacillus polysaccharolyticus]SCY96709.1 4-hydroxy 2-oxovalerate aldolase [Paenibacillus polysaccharolyticus]
MNIKILDCTLRDGGYINEWNFKYHNIKAIINGLTEANVDIVECGFLEDSSLYDINLSLFSDINQIKHMLPLKRNDTEYVAMTRFGNLNINNLDICDGTSISGLRITFHIDEISEAMEFCRQVKDKGYKVFVQPVGTTSYSDEELLSLIKAVNELNPYSFYIVDTLGIMTKNDVHRMFYLVDNNLIQDITVGFHSHNNLQLSFSNAQELISFQTKRTIVIDSSVYGMGRGAGNLNTELIAQHINKEIKETYRIDKILEIVDEYIANIKSQFDWGYSVPYYLAAIHNCHPNYASFFINKKTLQVSLIAKILDMIPAERRELYDEKLVETLYSEFQTRWIDDKESLKTLSEELSYRRVLIIAPGKNSLDFNGKISQYISDFSPIIISVQFIPDKFTPDFLFFSNRKRFNHFVAEQNLMYRNYKLITTSNIEQEDQISDYTLNYSSLLNGYSRIRDNSTLMILQLLAMMNVDEIVLAGFDGYNVHSKNNYINESMETLLSESILKEINEQISNYLSNFQDENDLKVTSITPSIFV